MSIHNCDKILSVKLNLFDFMNKLQLKCYSTHFSRFIDRSIALTWVIRVYQIHA